MTISEIKNLTPSNNNMDTDFTEVDVTTDNVTNNIDTKSKTYKVKVLDWYCADCDIYCNSDSQYDVHMISQKHKLILDENKRKNQVAQANTSVRMESSIDENNDNLLESDIDLKIIPEAETLQSIRARTNFSIEEIEQNPVAIRYNIDAVKYLITEDKKQGKFEKFGFYCKTCNAYMTGQIQLIMHVRGAKHQYFHPDEIPNYKPNKLYNPFHTKHNVFQLGHANYSKKNQSNNNNTDSTDITGTPKHINHQGYNNRNQSRYKHQSMDQTTTNYLNQTGLYHRNSYNNQSYNNQNKYFNANSQLYNMNTSSPALFNDPQAQYNFQDQVQQLAYNFKMHPVYAYQILLNQRLKQQQQQQQNLVSTDNENKALNEMHQQPTTNNIQYANNNQYPEQYFDYNQQQAHTIMPQYANVSTPTQQFTQKPSYQHLNAAPMKFGQNQSPIPYILPQNSTPPSSFNQTPINLQSNNNQQQQQQQQPHKKTDEKMFNSFNVFNTPPGSFSYYPSIQHHQ